MYPGTPGCCYKCLTSLFLWDADGVDSEVANNQTDNDRENASVRPTGETLPRHVCRFRRPGGQCGTVLQAAI